MIDNNELLFIVDEEDQPMGSKPRSETHKNGYWHRVAHVWIINNNHHLLCQQRSLLKDRKPGLWEPFFGGHLSPNESYEEGGAKEASEELGIKVLKKHLKYFNKCKSETAKEFQGVFIFNWDGNIDELNPEKDEVEKVLWYSIDDLYKIFTLNKNDWSFPLYSTQLLNTLK